MLDSKDLEIESVYFTFVDVVVVCKMCLSIHRCNEFLARPSLVSWPRQLMNENCQLQKNGRKSLKCFLANLDNVKWTESGSQR